MRSTRIFAAAALAVVLVSPDPADAQTSALAGRNVQVDEPMFTESATVHRAGGFSVSGYFAWFVFDEEEFFGDDFLDEVDVDLTSYEVGAGASFGVTDRLTVGATIPWSRTTSSASFEGESFEFEADGIGDVDLFGRALLWNSATRSTRLAALGAVALPTADDTPFDVEGEELEVDRSPGYTLGGAVSHDVGRASVHGSAQYTWAGDIEIGSLEGEGIDVLSFTGAAVFRLRPDLRLIGEVHHASYQVDEDEDPTVPLGGGDFEDEDFFEDATSITGGLRWSASPNVAVDGAVILPVSEDTISAVLVAGLNLWLR